MSRPPLPPFTAASAAVKARAAEDAWNSRDPERIALAYSEDSWWRNRSTFLQGRAAIVEFLTGKWERELDYRLVKEVWAHTGDVIAVRFAYEYHDADGQWFRAYGNENWRFDDAGLMTHRHAASSRRRDRRVGPQVLLGPSGPRPADHPGLSDLGCEPRRRAPTTTSEYRQNRCRRIRAPGTTRRATARTCARVASGGAVGAVMATGRSAEPRRRVCSAPTARFAGSDGGPARSRNPRPAGPRGRRASPRGRRGRAGARARPRGGRGAGRRGPSPRRTAGSSAVSRSPHRNSIPSESPVAVRTTAGSTSIPVTRSARRASRRANSPVPQPTSRRSRTAGELPLDPPVVGSVVVPRVRRVPRVAPGEEPAGQRGTPASAAMRWTVSSSRTNSSSPSPGEGIDRTLENTVPASSTSTSRAP